MASKKKKKQHRDSPSFVFKLESIKVIKNYINKNVEFDYNADKKNTDSSLGITLKIKASTEQDFSNIVVTVEYTTERNTEKLSDFSLENSFSIATDKLLKLIHNNDKNYNPMRNQVISYIVDNAIAQTRGVYQLNITDTKLHALSIPFIPTKDLEPLSITDNTVEEVKS